MTQTGQNEAESRGTWLQSAPGLLPPSPRAGQDEVQVRPGVSGLLCSFMTIQASLLAYISLLADYSLHDNLQLFTSFEQKSVLGKEKPA